MSQSSGTQKRSSVFFYSDVMDAADEMASKLLEHGLTDQQAVSLAEELGECALDCFKRLRGES